MRTWARLCVRSCKRTPSALLSMTRPSFEAAHRYALHSVILARGRAPGQRGQPQGRQRRLQVEHRAEYRWGPVDRRRRLKEGRVRKKERGRMSQGCKKTKQKKIKKQSRISGRMRRVTVRKRSAGRACRGFEGCDASTLAKTLTGNGIQITLAGLFQPRPCCCTIGSSSTSYPCSNCDR